VRLLNGVIEATSGSMRVLGLDPQVDGPALRVQTGVLTETPSGVHYNFHPMLKSQ